MRHRRDPHGFRLGAREKVENIKRESVGVDLKRETFES